eukprot:12245686-Alexandrium_andersonii.AAC.1
MVITWGAEATTPPPSEEVALGTPITMSSEAPAGAPPPPPSAEAEVSPVDCDALLLVIRLPSW